VASSDRHFEQIKAQIRMSGGTLGELADKAGVTSTAMSRALRERLSAKCEKVVADFLCEAPAAIWPSRYHPDGTRIMQRPALTGAPKLRRSKAA
jgi:lambda repressor-like predicted transcriptional regulator